VAREVELQLKKQPDLDVVDFLDNFYSLICTFLYQLKITHLEKIDPDPYLKIILEAVLTTQRIPVGSSHMLEAQYVFCNLTNIRPSENLLVLLGENGIAFVDLLCQVSHSSNKKIANSALSTLENLLLDQVDPELFVGSKFFDQLGNLMWRGQHEDHIMSILTAMTAHPDDILVEELLGTVQTVDWIHNKCMADNFPQTKGLEFMRGVFRRHS
jgi:hypothetical protein